MSEIKYWKIKADVSDDKIYTICGIENNPHSPHLDFNWWGNIPMPPDKRLKTNCQISINVKIKNLLPGALWNGGAIEIYSTRILPILDFFDVHYEVYTPIFITSDTAEKIVRYSYIIFRLLEVEDALDIERSTIIKKKYGDFIVPSVKTFVIKDQINKHFFRLKGFEQYQIISDELKSELLKNKIAGFIYIPEWENELDYFEKNKLERN